MLARSLLTTYPRTWRARYEDEFMAVLEQGVSWSDVADVLFGACDAWTVELVSTLRGPHGAAAKAIVI